MKRWMGLAAGLAAVVAAMPVAGAAEFPTKPITLILGFAPGGPSDVMARILTKKMEAVLKQPVVIENRAGAGGGIAANAVARAAPDGYTILLATGSSLAINVSLYKNLGYDPEKDFEPISLIGTQTNLLYTHPGSVPAKTLPEFVAYVKANPGKLTFGSGGIGTPAHLAGELLKVEAGIEMTHAPFRGTGQALQSVIGGHVPVAFNPPSPLLPHLESGALRAIAVTTLQRTSALPNVPTIAESGYPGFDAATWHAIVAPAGRAEGRAGGFAQCAPRNAERCRDEKSAHRSRRRRRQQLARSVARLHQVGNSEMGEGGEGVRRQGRVE